MSQYQHIIIKLYTLLTCPLFYSDITFLSQDIIIHSLLHLLKPLLLGQFLTLPLFLMTFAVLRSAGETFCRTFLRLDLFMFFSWLDWGCGFWKEDHEGQVSFSSHCLRARTVYMTHRCGCDLCHLAGQFVRFLHCKVTLPTPSPDHILWKEVAMHSPDSRSGDYKASLRAG